MLGFFREVAVEGIDGDLDDDGDADDVAAGFVGMLGEGGDVHGEEVES